MEFYAKSLNEIYEKFKHLSTVCDIAPPPPPFFFFF